MHMLPEGTLVGMPYHTHHKRKGAPPIMHVFMSHEMALLISLIMYMYIHPLCLL